MYEYSSDELQQDQREPSAAASCLGAAHVEPQDVQPQKELRLRVFRSIAELEQLRDIWTLQGHHPASIFDVFLVRSRLAPEVQRPHVIAVYRDESPLCILAGHLVHKRPVVNMGGARFHLLHARVLSFVRNGLIGDQTPATTNLLVSSISESLEGGEADLAELNNVALDSLLYSAARNHPRRASRDHFPSFVNHCRMHLNGGFDDFLASLPRKTRHNYRTYARRLETEFAGKIQIRALGSNEPLEPFLEATEQIARKTQQRKLGGGFFYDTATRLELQTTRVKGRLQAYILYIAGRPSAFLIGTQSGDTFYPKYTGYDPAFRRYSPGMYLLMRCIERFLESNRDGSTLKYDFGPGNQRYNRSFAHEAWHEATINIFAPTARGQTLKVLRSTLIVLHVCLRNVISKSKCRDKLVRIWRSTIAERRALTSSAQV